MVKQFLTERFELVNSDRVHITDYGIIQNEISNAEMVKLDVWIESNDNGKRFLRQVMVRGETYSMLKGIYSKKCYILLEKVSGNYYFLDMNDCGIRLFNDTFFDVEHFSADESSKILKWLGSSS